MIPINPDAERLIALLSERVVETEAFGEADWQRILELARKQSVAPALHARFRARNLTVPPVVAAQLRKDYLASAMRNTRLFHELGEILHALQAANIPVIPLKGACLAEAVYGNIALRPMGDIDLWVLRPQLDAARAVMAALGYALRCSRADRPQALQDALTGESQFVRQNAHMVELHWNIFPGEWLRHTARIDEDVIWRRATPSTAKAVRQLAPEDAVIQLCVHLAVTHNMSGIGLRTLLDLEFARRAWRIDWHTVGQRARSWRVSCATWLVLKLFVELLGDPKNELPISALAPSALRQFALGRLVSARFLAQGARTSTGATRFLLLLLLVDRPLDALVLVGRALFPDRTWLSLRYGLQAAPRWQWWLHRLGHPFLVAFRRTI
jgi:hypothetical protein